MKKYEGRSVFLPVLALVATLVAPVAHADNGNVRYEGRPVQVTLDHAGKSLGETPVLETDLATTIDRIETRVVWDVEPVTEIVCHDVPGDGKGDWKNFFNVPKADKPQALADAILGIGVKTAEKIVDDGSFFRSKPRTWDAFSDEINRVQDRFGGNIAYQVLSQYGQQNAQNLGYFDQEQCEEKIVYKPVQHTVEDRVPVRQVQRHFVMEISNSVLLREEKETIQVNFDGFDDSIQVSSNFNSYHVAKVRSDETSSQYELQATRRAVTPSNTLVVTASNHSGGLMLDIRDRLFDVDYAQQLGNGVVQIDVYQKRGMWIDKKIASFERTLSPNDAATQIDAGVSPVAKSEVYVRYRVKRLGSVFFNQSSSSAEKSNSVKY